jgi:hypothetical protein
MATIRPVSILILCSMMLSACKPHEESSAPPVDANIPRSHGTWPVTVRSEGGTFAITLKPTKGDIVRNEHFSLALSIDPASDGLVLKLDADMPAHRHGMHTQPEVVPLGGPNYRVDGMLFHMSGEWVVTVDVTSSGKTERANFPIHLK